MPVVETDRRRFLSPDWILSIFLILVSWGKSAWQAVLPSHLAVYTYSALISPENRLRPIFKAQLNSGKHWNQFWPARSREGKPWRPECSHHLHTLDCSPCSSLPVTTLLCSSLESKLLIRRSHPPPGALQSSLLSLSQVWALQLLPCCSLPVLKRWDSLRCPLNSHKRKKILGAINREDLFCLVKRMASYGGQ